MVHLDHVPVLVAEILAHFQPVSGDRLLDVTLGQGGHAEAYLTRSAPAGTVVGVEADAAALTVARERLKPFGQRVTLCQGNFANMKEVLREEGVVQQVNGTFHHILFDLGIGSHQLADSRRGFSFAGETSLSMRYGGTASLPSAQVASLNRLERRLGHLPDVADILRHTSEAELAEIIYTYGEERFRGRIARALHRPPYPASSRDMAARIEKAVPRHYRTGRLHPATRTFQALRLAVNRELEALAAALPQAYDLLVPSGILAIVSFHSLEDRIVKQTFRDFRQKGAHILTRKPISASEHELASNPRARSAKLRVLQRGGS